jgi:hypothetical protein
MSLPSPEDGNRSSFRNVVLFSLLEFQTMDKVQKTSNPECHTPSSEPFRIYTFSVEGILEKYFFKFKMKLIEFIKTNIQQTIIC